MKEIIQKSIRQVIILGVIFAIIVLTAFIRTGIVATTEIIGKQQNYNMESEEQVTIRNRTKHREISRNRKQPSSITTKNCGKQQ